MKREAKKDALECGFKDSMKRRRGTRVIREKKANREKMP